MLQSWRCLQNPRKCQTGTATVRGMKSDPFEIEISRQIWSSRYCYLRAGQPVDQSVEDSWQRVAQALADQEESDQAGWRQRYYSILSDFRFLPGGRILAGAGTGYDVTLFNCFVMGRIDDSMEGICDSLKEGTLTISRRGL
jgi:ribonucleoside-diphosphate reductase alpha chain